MRGFIARRGRISVMYSDNGTNFTGLNKALKQLDWTTIESEFRVNEIRWKFNPPSAPWWGGFWERLIGILKDLLRKNLGRSSLSCEELQTLLCECESVMNNRPLTYMSEEQELKTLTPSMFLQDLPLNDVPDLDQIEKTNIVKRWRHVQKVRENLKQRFRREYLGFLRSSVTKREDKINVGDIVLIGTDDKRRLHWLLGRVLELFPGKDGIIRLVKLRTQK
ncbi:bel12-ag transposon polyprotein, partial [Lasius niger]